jgi:6-phosphogluconolactonase/glucosamine-6-phosphate isomerase/deaminase
MNPQSAIVSIGLRRRRTSHAQRFALHHLRDLPRSVDGVRAFRDKRIGLHGNNLYTVHMIMIHHFETLEALITKTETLLRKTLAEPGNLMLSGGSTPYVIYNRLAAAPCPIHPERTLFLSDERMEPFDSDKNNAHNLMPMLRTLQCEDRFLRVNTALPAPIAAQQFEKSLQPMDRVDLGFLGMGTDGHTAGFFTLDQAQQKTGPLVLHTDRPDGMHGVSVTPAFLQRVQRLILLVTGAPKKKIIQTLLSTPEIIPAGVALSNHPGLEIWTDTSS